MQVGVVLELQPYLVLPHRALVATVVAVVEEIRLVVILVTQGLPIQVVAEVAEVIHLALFGKLVAMVVLAL
jgi:hypothetical protein